MILSNDRADLLAMIDGDEPLLLVSHDWIVMILVVKVCMHASSVNLGQTKDQL